MKKLLGIVVLGLLLCNVGFAEERIIVNRTTGEKLKPINNRFEIGGIHIGDSLTTHYSANLIKEYSINPWPNKTYYEARMSPKDNGEFDGYRIVLKTNDNKFIVRGISGFHFVEDKKDCKNKFSDYEKKTNKFFPIDNKKTFTNNHPADKTGKSKMIQERYYFKKSLLKPKKIPGIKDPAGPGKTLERLKNLRGEVRVTALSSCFVWSKEMGYTSSSEMSYYPRDFALWLATKAYK